MPSMNKLSSYRTTWENEADRGSVTYISTRIVSWDEDSVTLNSGGWMTVTTKRKMCQASNQFGLRFCVSQVKGEWFVDLKNPAYNGTSNSAYWMGFKIPFRDGMKFNRYTGEIVA